MPDRFLTATAVLIGFSASVKSGIFLIGLLGLHFDDVVPLVAGIVRRVGGLGRYSGNWLYLESPLRKIT